MKQVSADLMPAISLRGIFRVWWPLATTWIMMAIEGPLISALIARQAEPKINLAAFGVAFAIGMLMEAPVVMIMSASVRIVRDQLSFQKLHSFIMQLNFAVTAIMLLTIGSPIYNLIAFKFLGLSSELAELTRLACFLLLPWPAMIGYRRFYQGILIHSGASRAVAVGTMVRLAAMALCAFSLHYFGLFHGAALGASSLSVGVTAEAFAVRYLVRGPLQRIKKAKIHHESRTLGFQAIFRFYYPLALTGILGLVSQPIVTLAMNRAPSPLESLAVLPVINGLTFFFRAIPLSYQETVISLLGDNEDNKDPLRLFALLLGLVLTLSLTLIAFTLLSDLWFQGLSGLQPELAEFAKFPLQLLIFTPSLTLLLCWQRAGLIHLKKTTPITIAAMLELSGITLTLLISIAYFGVVGAVASSMALVMGRVLSTSYLGFIRRH